MVEHRYRLLQLQPIRINAVNGVSELIQTNSSGQLPAINGSNLTGITATQVGLSNVTNDAQLKASQLSTDGTMASDSDTEVPSQKAVVTYVAAQIGAIPSPASARRDIFIPTANQTVFTLSFSAATNTDCIAVNGDRVVPGAGYDYVLSGTTLTFNYGLLITDVVDAMYYH